MNATVISVSQVNRYVKSLLDDDANLRSLFVIGEISNFRENYVSGHLYFSLKDENSVIKAVMFKTEAARLKFIPTDGMKVICQARLSCYEKDGSYQLYVAYMQPDGAGAAAIKFQQLKEKLEREGLFSAENKKTLPRFPKKLAVITSDTGAAVRDVLNVHERRFPLCEILLLPVTVQGEGSAKLIINAIEYANKNSISDVILLTRGGGSAEDLSVFNDEALVRAVALSKIPIVSAIGHQTDFTLCDFAADLRAPTPSAAAEIILPDKEELKIYLDSLVSVLNKTTTFLLERYSNRLLTAQSSPSLSKTENCFIKTVQRIESLENDLANAFENSILGRENSFQNAVNSLELVSPLKILSRGYAVLSKDNKTIKSIKQLERNDKITVRLSDGSANCEIVDLEK